MSNHSVNFFDSQFQKQVASGEFALNPFEQVALPYLSGEVLDLGCGLGNLALAAARQGCRVTALDGSPNAITRIRNAAAAEGLSLAADTADLVHYRFERDWDAVVCIGLLMFFPEAPASALMAAIRDHVRPGGVAAVNVLTEGTTFLGMFEPGHYHLFSQGELLRQFDGWEALEERHDSFPAPGDTLKAFDTLIVRRPG
jgi:tellurite methyltransferase